MLKKVGIGFCCLLCFVFCCCLFVCLFVFRLQSEFPKMQLYWSFFTKEDQKEKGDVINTSATHSDLVHKTSQTQPAKDKMAALTYEFSRLSDVDL